MDGDAFEPVESPDETTVFPYHNLEPPSTADVYAARETVDRHLFRTPLTRSEPLSDELDADVYVKREDTLPTGSFKVRGFFSLVAGMDDGFRDRGLVTASMGNHGQAMAYAARAAGVPATVVLPETLDNPMKVAAMERLGAAVVRHGADFDEAREHAEGLATDHPYRYVHGGNEAPLVAGRASAGLEVMEALPAVDVVVNPVGGGSSAAGYCLTVGKLHGADVVGVQAAGADAVYRAWKHGGVEASARADTVAEGLATRTPFALPLDILREHLADLILVSDDEIETAIHHLLSTESIVAEGAAAASVAGVRALGDSIAGKTVVCVVSGRNLAPATLRRIVTERGDAPAGRGA